MGDVYPLVVYEAVSSGLVISLALLWFAFMFDFRQKLPYKLLTLAMVVTVGVSVMSMWLDDRGISSMPNVLTPLAGLATGFMCAVFLIVNILLAVDENEPPPD